MKKSISISILNVDNIKEFLKYINEAQKKLEKFEKITNLFDIKIHLDIMDNEFVPNKCVDLEILKEIKNLGFYTDVHLMVKRPLEDGYIDKAINYGADNIIIHEEIENFEKILNELNNKKIENKNKSGKDFLVGVSIKPNTKIDVLLKYSDLFSSILLMSVEPGFGGQEYIKETNDKIVLAKSMFKDKILQIDGGINFDTISEPLRFGIDSFVIGSYITKNSKEKIYYNLLKLNILKDIEDIEKTSNVIFDSKLLQMVPGGYGENNILIGVNVPNIRKCAIKWYKNIDIDNLDLFISSKYHDYKRFVIFCMSSYSKDIILKLEKNKSKNLNIDEELKLIEELNNFFEYNLKYINNWDLTDESGPNILANYIYSLNNEEKTNKILEYINNENIWIKRIGIVSLLTSVRSKNDIDFTLKLLEIVIYDKENLIQKASGWVLREVYKKNPNLLVKFIMGKNKEEKLPGILLSYACEKMSIEEKQLVKNI